MAAHNTTQRIRTAATNEAVFFAYRVAIPRHCFQVEKGNFYQMPYLYISLSCSRFPYDSASTGSPPPSLTRPGLPKRGKDGYSGIPHPQTKSVDKGKLPEEVQRWRGATCSSWAFRTV